MKAFSLIAVGCCFLFCALTVAATADEPKQLSADQRVIALTLQLDQEREAHRRDVLSLQVQIETLRGPQDAAKREQGWIALEATVCDGKPGKVDRQSLAVSCPPKDAK